VLGGQRVRKDTKTHQGRYLAIDPVTCALLGEHRGAIRAELAGMGLELPQDAYVFSNDPMGAVPWNPDWATHKVSELAAVAGVKLDIKALRHYADPVSEVDRRAAAYLANLTAGSPTQSDSRLRTSARRLQEARPRAPSHRAR
jgi:hypothetical protein